MNRINLLKIELENAERAIHQYEFLLKHKTIDQEERSDLMFKLVSTQATARVIKDIIWLAS